jgi:hypothetical protein
MAVLKCGHTQKSFEVYEQAACWVSQLYIFSFEQLDD